MARFERRPLVALSYARDSPAAPDWLRSALHALADRTREAFGEAGADSRILDPVAEARSLQAEPAAVAERLLDGVDALLVLGGADVDPSLYGQSPHPAVYGADRRVDEIEAALVRSAQERAVPVLGVCRGLQLINVVHGGSLVQHLPADGAHSSRIRPDTTVGHEVRLVEGSRLHELYGVDLLPIRSAHHQAIDRVAPGFRVTARADDGVVEAIESEPGSPWLLAVQWHPEAPDADPQHLRLLAELLLHQAR